MIFSSELSNKTRYKLLQPKFAFDQKEIPKMTDSSIVILDSPEVAAVEQPRISKGELPSGVLRMYSFEGDIRSSNHIKAQTGSWTLSETSTYAMLVHSSMGELKGAPYFYTWGSPIHFEGSLLKLPDFSTKFECKFAFAILHELHTGDALAIYFVKTTKAKGDFELTIKKVYETVRFVEGAIVGDPTHIIDEDFESLTHVPLDASSEYENTVIDFMGIGLCGLLRKTRAEQNLLNLYLRSQPLFRVSATECIGVMQPHTRTMEIADVESFVNDMFSRSSSSAQNYGVVFNTTFEDVYPVRIAYASDLTTIDAIFVLTGASIVDVLSAPENEVSSETFLNTIGVVIDENDDEDEENIEGETLIVDTNDEDKIEL